MTELSRYRLWLNWEAFEVAAINPLFTSDISIEKISQLASKLPPLIEFVSFEQWKAAVSSVFRLNENQIQALYATLTCFLTKDPQEALLQSQVYLTDSSCLPSFFTRGTDILCYLFALFVKKKFRAVSELSNLEAFPNRKDNQEKRISTQNRDVSKSTPTVSHLVIKTNKEQSLYPLMVRFFINKLPEFLKIYSPDGLTRQHVESFSFLVNGGPTFAHKHNSLAAVMGFFENTDVEPSVRFLHALKTQLPISKGAEDILNTKYDHAIVPTSPLSYRPLFPRSTEFDKYENTTLDKPLLIEYETTHTQEPPKYRLEVPETPCNVHVYNCRHATIYICSSVLTVFISHCRDSTIFIGAAVSVHLEACQNVKIICATRMAHLDACQRCVAYMLVNTRPIVTGNCSRLVFAPYNALYTKFGLDTLCIGINPQLNLWDKPIFLASLGAALFEKISPANFRLFVVPMTWANVNPIVNAPIPQEYSLALEQKRQAIMSLKTDLEIIAAKDRALYEKLTDMIQGKGAKAIQDEGHMLEITWLTNHCPDEKE
ncbi:hypothetical protein TRFO_21626 [Tritrichomonas foetus]|uniref:TBCC domain-containing protein 1 n=1 Tax=Tritrichomonas foetus TaxID=1144522 RepID=A0A1J4KEQ0_9EUKA|nr:hypothetical protein TRFO_21626 [Tritrichomonas foetus]|eukprot:OHT09408.1 hypothetical protein TRFO_21626 [Tritrichomonas foetus]